MMKRLAMNICAGGLSILMALTSVVPAQAITMPGIAVPQQHSDVQQVRDRRGHWGHGRPYWRGHGHHGYRGYRGGYRYRHGYRHHGGGAWVPFAALAAGAIIAGAASQPAYRSSHARWCASRYRSYRASDNTFQPYHGPRRQCVR